MKRGFLGILIVLAFLMAASAALAAYPDKAVFAHLARAFAPQGP